MQNQQPQISIPRAYYTIAGLRDERRTTEEQIRYLIENRQLPVYLRPALVFYATNEHHQKACQPIQADFSDICRPLHEREATLKILSSDLPATYKDIIVKESDRQKFELTNTTTQTSGRELLVLYSENWTYISFYDKEMCFDPTQVAVLCHLYKRRCAGAPLVGVKDLLAAVHTNCRHLDNLFHNKEDWRDLIVSPERGYCKLNLPDGVKAQRYQPSLFDDLD